MSNDTDVVVAPRGPIGEEAKPRVLFSWQGQGPVSERVAAVLDRHAPTVRVIDDLRRIRQDDYDVLVTNRLSQILAEPVTRLKGVEPHVFVISFAPHGETSTSAIADSFLERGDFYGVRWSTGYLSKAVELGDGLLPAATDLVNDDLIPTALSRNSHTSFKSSRPPGVAVLAAASPGGVGGPRLPDDAFILRPFLRTAGRNPQVLAGWYTRGERSEGWVLPSDVRRPWDWVAAAIRHWAVTYRRFPLVGGWWEDPRWQTLAETHATATRTKLKQELADLTARLQEEIAAATADLDRAQQDAAGGRRRLLTDKGDSLKEAAVQALEELGYEVIDRDQQQSPDGGGRIEDLGVVDPDEAAVDPVIEVKGYDKGAKAGDALKMARHMARAQASGRSPSAIWWVINHWRTQAPAERGLVLAGEEALIAEDADEDAPLVLIDTTTLFRVIRAVEEGALTPDQVRASLRAAKGRWDIELVPGEPATGDSA